ncbi:MAG: metallopeptidase family protein [Actinobacteria bacterium]|jgi:predicted Zn-dependent protease with MMP-like domain|uniref:Acetylglutamate kinase n=1 Tax=hydrothermal vent metagenome TaxID=652676 RepID=A0A3B0SL96_9ZZZZ|nr:metallopeptidase family protein [Actinomycetota bacterium]
MNRKEFEELVDAALSELPADIANEVDNVLIVVEDRPNSKQAALGNLLGLYHGVPLPERGNHYFGAMPDRISIFMEPHLAMGLSEEKLRAQIRRTVLHEMAHHLGIDDDRLREINRY